MAPVLLIAAGLSLLMVVFNDQVLPRANHRLSILLGDIVSVRPTVGLQEQVLKSVTPTFYIKAGWIDETSNRMRDVQIYDLQNSQERRSVYADSGTFTMSADSADLQLVLFDGEQLQFPEGNSRQLQRTFFREQVLLVRDFAQGFTASSRDGKFKSEREQGICELQEEYRRRAEDYEQRRQRWIAQLRAEASEEDSVLRVPRPRPAHSGLATLYCKTIPSLFLPSEAEAAQPPVTAQDTIPLTARQQDSARAVQDSLRQLAAQREAARIDSIREELRRRDEQLGTIRPQGVEMAVPDDGLGPDGQPLDSAAMAQAQTNAALEAGALQTPLERRDSLPLGAAMFAVTPEALELSLREMSKYAVEVQKKFAISMACFVFVLFGPPIALRFPRGGVGVTLGVSLVVFGAYYACLMVGETLADKGTLDARVAMWAANVIFTIAGIVLTWRVERITDASRGGGPREWWDNRRNKRALKRAASRPVAVGVRT
jgi:lipopolysaccharide export system permease protein